MLKEYLKENNISIYKLAKDTGISYSTINDLVNGVVSVENSRAYNLRVIARYMGISMDELYDMCLNTLYIKLDKLEKPIRITVKNKKYHIDFFYGEQNINVEYEYSVNSTTRRYIENIAKWDVEDYIENLELEALANEIFNNAKR